MSHPVPTVRDRPRAVARVSRSDVGGWGPGLGPEAGRLASFLARLTLVVLLLLSSLAMPTAAQAQAPGSDEAGRSAPEPREGIAIEGIRIEASLDGEGFELSADFAVLPPPRLAEAVSKGVVLYFLAEAELFEPRWYWWDDRISSATLGFRLSYHALTRLYRLSTPAGQQQFTDLEEALRALGRVRGWRIVDADKIRYGRHYVGQMRVRLDPAHLPKPFQLTAITNKDWTLQAEWKRFEFKP